MSRRLTAFCASLALLGTVTTAILWSSPDSGSSDFASTELPTPPFPPRITEGTAYETCLATLAGDPISAISLSETWQANGGGEGALHCHGLALIAVGRPADGASELDQLSQLSAAPPLARATVLGQAAQARLMVAQAEMAADDASLALKLSPQDTELFIMLGTAEGMQGRLKEAVDDISAALRLEAGRTDALVLRAMMRRKLDQLDLAQADVSQALTLDPDNADALLERGILRQRMGDPEGARADWEHARGIDPNTTTADLAEQNLSLLEAGPQRQ